MNGTPILHSGNISFSYGDSLILEGIDFSLHRNEFVGIIGPNGSGKSTFLRILSRILKPDTGSVTVHGKDITEYSYRDLAGKIAMVQQETAVTFPYRVDSFILMGRHPYLGTFQIEGNEDFRILDSLLQDFNLEKFRSRVLTELSGGERQRVIIASALAQEPELLLLDEPTTALDLEHQIKIYKLLQQQVADSLSIVSVTHDINLAAEYCTRLVLLCGGKIRVEGTPDAVITKENLMKYYNIEAEIIRHPEKNVPFVIPLKERRA